MWNSRTSVHRCFIREMRKDKTIQAYSVNQSVLQAGLHYVEHREKKRFIFLVHRSTYVPEHQIKHMLTWLCFRFIHWFCTSLRQCQFGDCKTAKSLVSSFRPSAWNNSPPTKGAFMKSDTSIFRKLVENIQLSLKSGKLSSYFI